MIQSSELIYKTNSQYVVRLLSLPLLFFSYYFPFKYFFHYHRPSNRTIFVAAPVFLSFLLGKRRSRCVLSFNKNPVERLRNRISINISIDHSKEVSKLKRPRCAPPRKAIVKGRILFSLPRGLPRVGDLVARK